MIPTTVPHSAMIERTADEVARPQTTSETAPKMSPEATNQLRSPPLSDRRAHRIIATAPQMYGIAPRKPATTTPKPNPLRICGIHRPRPTEPIIAQKFTTAHTRTRQFVKASLSVEECSAAID